LIQLKRWIFLACTVCVLSATACTPPGPQTPTAPETGIIVKEPVTLTILYTNDEHGWMAGEEDHGGAASMMHLWTEEEGYTMNG
jgi:2',3'-cyclic-nucleotide 2'-phosphodiesterase (5'-nucleotidase family)